MRLPIVFIPFLQVVVADPFKQVFGYLGESVTLPSGADPSWNISTIEWSILSNSTWIATYRHKRKNIERFWRYKGRLSLNTSSGDLTINHLTREDALEYTVDFTHTVKVESHKKVKLIVRQHLQKPSIHERFNVFAEGGCLMALQCSSPDEGVDISWQTHPSYVAHPASFDFKHHTNHTSEFWTFFSLNSEVNFICTSSNSVENASSLLRARCYDKKPKETRSGFHLGCILMGCILVVGVLLVVVYFVRDKIQAAWKYLSDKFSLMTNSATNKLYVTNA